MIYDYDDERHIYYADGDRRISVTQALDVAGLVSPFCKDEASRWRGSEVHRLSVFEDTTGLNLKTVPVRLRGYLRAIRKFKIDTGFVPRLIEHRVDCEPLNYAGRFDRLGTRPNMAFETLLDYKTGAIADYVRLQLIGYAHAYMPNRLFERIAVQLKADGTYNCKPFALENFLRDREEWIDLLRKIRRNDVRT